MSAKTTKHPPWGKSKGKNLLMADLQSGSIPLSGTAMSIRDIFEMRPEFAEDDPTNLKKFAQRLRSARKQVSDDKSRAASDSISLAKDRTIHPKPLTNYRGEPLWDGSAAQAQLGRDMDNGVHNDMKPKELHLSNEEYTKFPLKVFRQHIYQEENRRKYVAQQAAIKRRHED